MQEETLYRYDLARMLQTNTKTTFARAIRRSPSLPLSKPLPLTKPQPLN
jgi:hypothetical protein